MKDRSTFVAYIDESGDEGFKFGAGSSEWFVLSAVIFHAENELAQVKLIDDVRDRLNRDRPADRLIPARKPLHFRDLKHEQRKFYTHRIAQADVHTVALVIQKPALTSPERFQSGSRLYHYGVHLLIERVSWYCRDHRRRNDVGNGTVDLVFSNRATMDYDDLRDYLRHLERDRIALGYQAAEGIIRPDRLESHSAGRRLGLQIADAVASSYWYAVEKSAYDLTEDSYARLLLPRAYRHNGVLWGYGVKILPREAEEERREGTILPGW